MNKIGKNFIINYLASLFFGIIGAVANFMIGLESEGYLVAAIIVVTFTILQISLLIILQAKHPLYSKVLMFVILVFTNTYFLSLLIPLLYLFITFVIPQILFVASYNI